MKPRSDIRSTALAAGRSCRLGELSGGADRLIPAVLAEEDLDAVVALHEAAVASAPHGTVRHDAADFFGRILAGDGALLGYRLDGGSLAAYGVLSFRAADEAHYGRILGLAESEWPRLAQLEGISVDRRWQGLGIQRLLGLWRIATAEALGYGHVAATAAPENFYSWRNLLALGLVIRKLELLYGGFPRYVLHRELGRRTSYQADWTVEVGDLPRQRSLFAAGAVAYGWRGEPRPVALLFARAGRA